MAEAPRVAIVTGGSRGIGRACALKLAAAGYVVVVNYAANRKAAEDVVNAVAAAGGRAVAVKGDVARETDVLALFAAARLQGIIRVLINNAGIVDLIARLDEMSAARMQRMMDVNVLGSLLCAREAVLVMSTRHGGLGGAIVNVSSAGAVFGAPNMYVDYAASKGAIDTFTVGLGREVAGEGIRVNAVRPGIIDTEIHAVSGDPDRPRKLAGTIPMQRAGTVGEVANMICWLCSDEASYVTGSIFNVAGGRV